MSRSTKYALVGAIMAAAMVAVVVLNVFLATHAIDESNQRWCATLDLLTSKPVPKPADPADNQSREGEYRLYVDFVTLRSEFGCR